MISSLGSFIFNLCMDRSLMHFTTVPERAASPVVRLAAGDYGVPAELWPLLEIVESNLLVAGALHLDTEAPPSQVGAVPVAVEGVPEERAGKVGVLCKEKPPLDPALSVQQPVFIRK